MDASCLDEARALAFVAGSLPTVEREGVEAHVDDCDACRQVLAALVRGGALESTQGAGATPAAGVWHEGHTIGRYVVRGPLGRGGMGSVYRADDTELGRPVALKRLHATADAQTRARLVREARAAAQLAHPNVVTIYEVGDDAGTPFIAMELVDGITLARWLAATPRTWREIVVVLAQAGRGLAAAHERGLVHRDFKPDNVLVDRTGRARVADFGLARAWDGERGSPARGAALARMTATGVVSGTPAYLAPELVDGGAPGAASDQYAFAVTLHEALRGQHPFAGTTPTALWAEMAAGRIRDVGRAIPAWLDRAVRRGLAVEPTARWPSVGSLVEAIERPPRRMWPWLAGAGVVATASLALAIVALVMARSPAAPKLAPGDMVPEMKQLLSNATLRGVDGDHAGAFGLAALGLAADPTNGWAAMLVASEACRVHLDAVGRATMPRVPAEMRETVQRACRPPEPEHVARAPAAPPPAPKPRDGKPPSQATTDELNELGMGYMDDPKASLAKVERILRRDPGNGQALRLATLIACDLNYDQKLHGGTADERARSEAKARAFAAQLTPHDRWLVWSECDRWSGIWLEGDVERAGKIEHIGPRPPKP